MTVELTIPIFGVKFTESTGVKQFRLCHGKQCQSGGISLCKSR